MSGQGSFFDDTLGLERERLEAERTSPGGTTCRACDGRVIEYAKRRISSSMARGLISAYRRFGRDWFHANRELAQLQNTNFAMFTHWGLVVPKPPHEKPSSGYWRITEAGVAFVERRRTVDKYAREYNHEVLELWGGPWSIDDALGSKWDWGELMGGAT